MQTQYTVINSRSTDMNDPSIEAVSARIVSPRTTDQAMFNVSELTTLASFRHEAG